MKKALKELIEQSTWKRKGVFKSLIIVSNGKYDGFFGSNGYDNLLILGFDVDDKKYYKITDSADVFNIFDIPMRDTFSLDIPTEYGVPRMWFTHPIYIDNELNLSTVTGDILKGESK